MTSRLSLSPPVSEWMSWHEWLVLRGYEAAAFTAILALLTLLYRWAGRMRAKTRQAFAEAVGAAVGEAMQPTLVSWEQKLTDIDGKLNAHMSSTNRRRLEDDERWAKTEELYAALQKHMSAEDG